MYAQRRQFDRWRFLVHLVYLDDGGKERWFIFGGVVLDDQQFQNLEINIGFLVSELFQPERRDSFTEFHASDLFLGERQFEGIPEAKRHDALRQLVTIPGSLGAPYLYSAIDRQALAKSPVSSASAHDFGFQMCALTIDEILRKQVLDEARRLVEAKESGDPLPKVRNPLALFIVDECDKSPKGHIKHSFRRMRRRFMLPPDDWASNPIFHSVDDLFFGDSAGSIGLQVADACNYIMWRRIAENIQDEFYAALMTGSVECAKPEPQWSRYRHLLRDHASL